MFSESIQHSVFNLSSKEIRMWVEPEVLERELMNLMNYLKDHPDKCPLTLAVIEKRLDEVREWQRQRLSKRRAG